MVYSPWGCKESDTTERLTHSTFSMTWPKSRGTSYLPLQPRPVLSDLSLRELATFHATRFRNDHTPFF